MFKSLRDLPCMILCAIVFECVWSLEFPLYIIKEEGSEEAAGVGGSRNWMMDYSMFSSQPDDGCHSLHYSSSSAATERAQCCSTDRS